MKIFIIILKKYSFEWNEKIFIRFLMNKKEMYSNKYFHSFFYSFIRIRYSSDILVEKLD